MKKKKKPPSPSPARPLGVGVSTALLDRAFWLPDDPTLIRWVAALEAIDRSDDHDPLLALLKEVVPPTAFPHVADLFARKKFRRVGARGRHPVPSYERTTAEALLELAEQKVVDLVTQDGVPYDDALARATDEMSLLTGREFSSLTLDNYINGKRGSTHRMKKRRTR